MGAFNNHLFIDVLSTGTVFSTEFVALGYTKKIDRSNLINNTVYAKNIYIYIYTLYISI